MEQDYALSESRYRALRETDDMPGPLRECVHEFGFAIVQAFRLCGVTDPQKIRTLVHACWEGARAPGDRTGKKGRKRSPILDKLDWLLIQNGSGITAETLVRVLWNSNVVIMPVSPSDVMVDASINEAGNMGLVSKREKHRGRLRAALMAQARSTWPHLFQR